MLTHALQNLPVQFTIRFLIVVGITALLIISALKNIRKYIDMVLNKQQLSAPGGKTPEKESVLKKLEEAKAAQTTKKTETKNHTQEI